MIQRRYNTLPAIGPTSCVCLANGHEPGAAFWVSKVSLCLPLLCLQVRPNEVDMYGVVTHPAYAEYMYAARAASLAAMGCGLEVMLQKDRCAAATTHLSINYKG